MSCFFLVGVYFRSGETEGQSCRGDRCVESVSFSLEEEYSEWAVLIVKINEFGVEVIPIFRYNHD